MENYFFLGIDVSKKNLDCCLLNNGNVVKQDIITNHPKSIEKYLSGICADYSIEASSLIVCAEYTGMYIYPLTVACSLSNISFGLKIRHKLNTVLDYSEVRMIR